MSAVTSLLAVRPSPEEPGPCSALIGQPWPRPSLELGVESAPSGPEQGAIVSLAHLRALGQWSPTFLALGTSFMENNFSMNGGGGDGFGMIQAHYIYCALYFHYYYIVIYNEIILHLTIMQNLWEP